MAQRRNCALWLARLSLSLRCCSVVKTYCKTLAKIKIVVSKRYTLHTFSTRKRYFEKKYRKNVSGSNTYAKCARRVYFYCGFVLIIDARPFWSPRSLCVDVVYFLMGLYNNSPHLGNLNRNIAGLLYGIVTFGCKCLGDHFHVFAGV